MNRIALPSLAHLVTAAVVAGCGASLTDPDAAPEPGTTPHPEAAVTQETEIAVGDTVILELGESGTFEPAGTEVTFLRLVGDSRCPLGLTCVWEGDAEVEVRVLTNDGGSDVRLHTTLEPQAVAVGTDLLRLVDVLPYPTDDPLANPAPLRIVVTLEAPAPGS